MQLSSVSAAEQLDRCLEPTEAVVVALEPLERLEPANRSAKKTELSAAAKSMHRASTSTAATCAADLRMLTHAGIER